MTSGTIDVRWTDVSKTYDQGRPVRALRPTSLDVMAGEFVAVTGPSGAGKSTLLNLMGLLDVPTGGRYELLGTDVTQLGERARTSLRAQCLGFVFQAFHLVAGHTASDNVETGMIYQGVPRGERRERAMEMLRLVGLDHRTGSRVETLSGGEQQRVAIARAMACTPRILLADEPTGNLDSRTGARILDLLEDLHADGLTIVAVTHDPLVARRAQRIVSLLDGEMSE